MRVARIVSWRWWPKTFRSQHVNAPYRTMIHFGFWLFLFGGRNE